MTIYDSDELVSEYLPFVGRAFLGLAFLYFGVTKVAFGGSFSGFAANAIPSILPVPTMVAAFVVAIEALGGLALLLGVKTREVAAVIAGYLVIVNLMVHQFWADPSQLSTFMKNLGLIGGLLAASAQSSGKFSLDSKIE
jgi:putative oxidoreductase